VVFSRSSADFLPQEAQNLLRDVLSGQDFVKGNTEAFLTGLDRQLASFDLGDEASDAAAGPETAQSTKAQVRRPKRPLPRGNSRLIGREEWISEVTRSLSARLKTRGYATVLVSGQPGSGKSAVAIKAARDLLPLFPEELFTLICEAA